MLSLKIAARYLVSRKSHNAVNVISMVALAAVAVAAAAMVCVLSVYNGFRSMAEDRLSLLDPPLTALPVSGKVIDRADSVAAVIAALPGVAGVAPVLVEQGLVRYDDMQTPATLMAVDDRWRRLGAFDSIVVDGEPVDGAAWLSVGVAVSLQAHPDPYKRFSVYVPRRVGRINPAAPMNAFRSDTLAVSAVWQSERAEYDADRIIMPLDDLREMLDYYDGEASRIAVAVVPGTDVGSLAELITRKTGLKTATPLQLHPDSFKLIEIEKWMTFVMLAFILIIASFNIISTLSMLIIEKRESMFILRAMGMSRRQIDSIFVVEGWLISFFGGLAGVVIGCVLTLAQQWGEFIKLAGDHSRMLTTVYPVRLEITDLVAVMTVVILVGFLTGMVTLLSRKDK